MKMIIIYPWMLKHFKGLEVLIFAVVYSFDSYRKKTMLRLDTWLDLLQCSRSQFYASVKNLITNDILQGSILEGLSLVKDFSDNRSDLETSENLNWDELIASISGDED